MRRWFFCALLAVMAVPVFGATYQFEQAELNFEVPDAWKQEKTDEMTVFNAPDGGMYLETYTVAAKDVDTAIDQAVDDIAKRIKDAKVTREPEKIELNGLKAVIMGGTGTLKGDNVKWLLCIVGGKAPAFFLGIVEENTFEEKKDEFLHVFHSIKAD